MQCEIWFPGSYDWENLTVDDILAKGIQLGTFHPSKPDPAFVTGLRKWEEQYQMPYGKFRADLKKIAAANWQKLNVPIVSHPSRDSDHYYCITDDDDLFNPDMPSVIGSMLELLVLSHLQSFTPMAQGGCVLSTQDNREQWICNSGKRSPALFCWSSHEN